jgi:hypothetical protein
MALTDDLISQFVKITNDKKDVKEESTVYGTIKIRDGRTFVQLDGANDEETLTPVTEAASAIDGERVTVMIKNHTAIVTGNLSSPLARSGDVDDVNATIHDFQTVLSTKVSTEELEAERARIADLEADNVVIKGLLQAGDIDADKITADILEVKESLTATQATIENLKTTKLDAEIANAKYATIENLEATNADIHNLEATYGEFEVLTTEKLEATDASIKNLQTDKLDANTASITYAKITDLDASNADIDNLQAGVAKIDTLIFGSATGDTIQTSFANSVIAQLGDAQIKSAMIESVSADKITAGDIITNNVRVRSEDGSLVISDETMQISDSSRVRVQIGKDAVGDYSINIWDADGNLMFSKGGITDSAIKDAIIRNDMVSDTANIAAHKLDIDSLFEEINGSTNTIKSTQIYLDDQAQTLNAAFKELETNVSSLGNSISSQGTQLEIIQGQFNTKVWQQDINTATNEMTTQYSTLEQELDGIAATVASHTAEIDSKADNTTVTNVTNKVANLETNLNGFQSRVSSTYATKTEVSNIEVGGRNLLRNSRGESGTGWTYAGDSVVDDDVKGTCLELQNSTTKEEYFGTPRTGIIEPSTEYTFSVDMWCDERFRNYDLFWLSDTFADPKTAAGYVNIVVKSIQTLAPNKWTRVSWTFTTNSDDRTGFIRIDHNGTNAEGTASVLRIANLKLEKGNRATDWTPAPEDLEDRVDTAETKILQNTNSITSLATRTTTVENKFAGYSTTEQMNSAIAQSANSITSSVRETYTTKTEFADLDIGGRNLVAGTDDVTVYSGNKTGGNGTYKDVWAAKTIDIPTATEYIVSFDAKADVAQTIRCHFYSPNTTLTSLSSTGQYKTGATDGTADVTITTEWARYWVKWTQTPADTKKSIIVGRNTTENDIHIRAVKFEVGNKATDWSPAPEDMATEKDLTSVQTALDSTSERITEAESLIQQLSDSITMLVTDSNGESLMVQTESGWTFSTAQIQDTINSTSENLNNLTHELGDIDTTVNTLRQAVTDLGVLNDYVKIGTYENEPCIELGESDSDFKLMVTNTRIMFMEGSGVPAYINNQSLYIKKAVVEEELQQGDFVWQVRSNGNLGLVWKGAIS